LALVLLNQTSKQMKRKEIIERIEDTLIEYKNKGKLSEIDYGYMYACKHILKLLKNK
jgi:hypothetical protein